MNLVALSFKKIKTCVCNDVTRKVIANLKSKPVFYAVPVFTGMTSPSLRDSGAIKGAPRSFGYDF